MFGVGSQELLLILLVVLLLFGGKRIPEVARSLGKGMAEIRRAMHEVQREVDLEMLKTPEPDRRAQTSGSPPPSPAKSAAEQAAAPGSAAAGQGSAAAGQGSAAAGQGSAAGVTKALGAGPGAGGLAGTPGSSPGGASDENRGG